MAIQYTWKITRLEAVSKDGLDNVAMQACFDVSGVDENDKRGFAQGDVLLLPPSDPDRFVPINHVTENQATSWTQAALGDRVAFYEKLVADQIASQYAEKPKAVNLAWMDNGDAV